MRDCIFLLPVLIVTGLGLPLANIGTNYTDDEGKLFEHIAGLTQLLNTSIIEKCIIPPNFKLSENTNNTDYPPISRWKNLDTLCNTKNSNNYPRGTVQLCSLIGSMLNGICNFTHGVSPPKGFSFLRLNTLLFDELKTHQNNSVELFCSRFIEDDRLLQITDLGVEHQDFYATLLLKNNAKNNNTTHRKLLKSQKSGSCISVCQNYHDEAIKEFNLQINPLCIVLNFTSIAYNTLLASNKQPRSTTLGNDTLAHVKIADIGRVSKRKGTTLIATEAHMGTQRKPSSSVSVGASNLKELSPEEWKTIPLRHEFSNDPENHDRGKETPTQLVNHITGISSSTTAPSVVDGSAEPAPPLIDKYATAAGANANHGQGQNAMKGNASTLTSSSEHNPEATRNKNNENDLHNQFPIQEDGESDYASPNLEGPSDDEGLEKIDNSVIPNNNDHSDRNMVPIKQDATSWREHQPVIVNFENETGGYFSYFVFVVTFIAILFLVFHNKRRLIAYIVEGRNPRRSRLRSRRNSTSETSYRRLENNFE